MDDRVLISNLMLLPGALLLLAGYRMFRRTREWMGRLVEAKAEIVDCIADEDDEGVSYRAVYRYAGIDNAVVGGNFNVREPPAIGKKVVIHYDPSYPTNAFLKGSRAAWFTPGCTFVLGIGLIVWAIWVRFDPSI